MNMMLSRHLTAKKITFPGYVSRKFDGVPGGYTCTSLESRQGKPLNGVKWIHDMIKDILPDGVRIWAEHWEPYTPFQTISGKVRKDRPYKDCFAVIHNVDMLRDHNITFRERQNWLQYWYAKHYQKLSPILFIADQLYVTDIVDLWKAYDYFKMNAEVNGDLFEGCMYHSEIGTYTPNKRNWHSMKVVQKPTVDLRVVDLFEAIDEKGHPKGMVGSMLCHDRVGQPFVVSAGKASHEDRRMWWTNPQAILDKIIVVQHKGDGFYEGLREPTFQAIHQDKIVPDRVVADKE